MSVKEDTLEPLVHYYSVEKKTRWTRTLGDFCEYVAWPTNENKPRFDFECPASLLHLAQAAGLDDLVNGIQALLSTQTFMRDINMSAVKIYAR